MKSMPASSMDVLLVHRDFLTGLSRSLLASPQDADDLSQETWLAALKRPPSHDANVRGWFKTVASRFVFSDSRSKTQRAHREVAFAPKEPTPSAAEIAEREAARREVVEAVLALDEPYREPIVLRYYEDLPPREIARRLDIPVETVRTRLKRGLERMRTQMDTRHSGDRAAWSSALMPLAWPGAVTSTTTSVGLAASFGFHRLLMVAALLTMVVVPVFLILKSDNPQVGPKGSPEAPAILAAIPGMNALPGEGDPIEDVDGTSRDAVKASTSLRIQGVVRSPDGSPAAGAEVGALGVRAISGTPGLTGKGSPADNRATIQTVADNQGRFTLGPIEPGLYELIAKSKSTGPSLDRAVGLGGIAVVGNEVLDSPDATMILRALGDDALAVRTGAPATRDIMLDDPTPVSGKVIDERGNAVAGATVAGTFPTRFYQSLPMPFGDILDFLGPFAATTTSRADGSFSLSLMDGSSLAAKKSGYFAAHETIAIGDSNLASRNLMLSSIPRFVLRGEVRDQAGQAIADAEVFLAHADDTARKSPVDRSTTLFDEVELLRSAERDLTRTLADGSFHFDTSVTLDDDPWAEAPTSWHRSLRLVAAADGFLPTRSVEITPDANDPDGPGERVLVLTGTRQIQGVITDATSGARIEGAMITTQFDAEQTGFPYVIAEGQSDAQGNFALNAPADELHLRIEADGYQPHYDRPIFRSERDATAITIELQPTAITIAGRFVDLSGEPLPRMLTTPHDVLGEISTSFYGLFAFSEDPSSAHAKGERFDALMSNHGGIQARIESDGSFSVPDRTWPNGRVWLVAIVNQLVHEVREVGAHSGETVFRVDPELGRRYSTLTLVGKDSHDRDLKDLSFDVFRPDDQSWVTHAFWTNRGQATAMVREPGRFDVIVRSEGYGRVTLRGVHLPVGGRIGPVEVILPAERRLIGKVRMPGSDETPCSDALVRVYTQTGAQLFSQRNSEDGTFEVAGLGEGRLFVTATVHQEGTASTWVDMERVGDNPVSLTIDGSTWLEVGLSDEAPSRMMPRVNLTIRDSDGFVRAQLNSQIMKGYAAKLFLARGSYRLTMEGAGNDTKETTLEISGEGATRIDWDLLEAK